MSAKIKITNRMWYVFVVLIFIFLISCRTSKLDPNSRVSKLDPNSEKIAVLGEDYTIEKYKMKKRHIEGARLTFDLSTKDVFTPAKYFYFSVNGIPFNFPEDKNTMTIDVESGSKYTAKVGMLNYKMIYIYNIKPQQRDSIVIKVCLFDDDKAILY